MLGPPLNAPKPLTPSLPSLVHSLGQGVWCPTECRALCRTGRGLRGAPGEGAGLTVCAGHREGRGGRKASDRRATLGKLLPGGGGAPGAGVSGSCPGDPRAPPAERECCLGFRPQPLGREHSRRSRWAWCVFTAQNQGLRSVVGEHPRLSCGSHSALSFLGCNPRKATQEEERSAGVMRRILSRHVIDTGRPASPHRPRLPLRRDRGVSGLLSRWGSRCAAPCPTLCTVSADPGSWGSSVSSLCVTQAPPRSAERPLTPLEFWRAECPAVTSVLTTRSSDSVRGVIKSGGGAGGLPTTAVPAATASPRLPPVHSRGHFVLPQT